MKFFKQPGAKMIFLASWIHQKASSNLFHPDSLSLVAWRLTEVTFLAWPVNFCTIDPFSASKSTTCAANVMKSTTCPTLPTLVCAKGMGINGEDSLSRKLLWRNAAWSHLPRLCIYTPCDHTVALSLMHVHTENPRPWLIEFNVFGCYQKSKCKIEHTTVDGKYPSPFDTVVVSCSHYLQGFIYIPGGAVFPSTVFYHFKDLYKSSLKLVVSSAKKPTSHATPMLCHQLQGARLCGFVDRMGTNLMPNFSEKHPRILQRVSLNCTFFFGLSLIRTQNLRDKTQQKSWSPKKKWICTVLPQTTIPFTNQDSLFQHPFLTEVSYALEVLKLR